MSFFNSQNSQNGQSPPANNNTCNCTDSNGNQCTPQKSSSWNPMNWFSGGRRRTVRRGGGFRPYTDQNIASTASRFSGGQTAQPHQWTGGKRRRGSKKTRGKRRSFKCNKCSKRTRHKH